MRGFGRGVQLIEKEDGRIELTYVEHSRLVFSSPRTERLIFTSWNAAINFLKFWDTLGYVDWWTDNSRVAFLQPE